MDLAASRERGRGNSTSSVASTKEFDESTIVNDVFEATETSLLFTGAKTMYGSSGCNARISTTEQRPVHARKLSFAETINPITLTWSNINVSASETVTGFCGRIIRTKERLRLLNDVNGIASSGRLVAIMGASGAGKSTLLNVLAMRNLKGLQVQGEVKVNGSAINKSIKSISAYIQQQDMFVQTFKVKEHLWFQAQLRMDPDIPPADRKIRIEEVLREMGLRKCANTVIGVPDSGKGISGGEMKRLSFASEILTNPPLLLCDEPTSGLDSFMAYAALFQILSQNFRNASQLI